MRIAFIPIILLSAVIFGCSSTVDIPKQTKQSQGPNAKDAQLIKEGIKLHDAGKYDEAIHKYDEALQSNPHNMTALYEKAFSYSAKGD